MAVDLELMIVDLELISVDLEPMAVDLGLIAVDLEPIAVDLGLMAVDLRAIAVDLGLMESHHLNQFCVISRKPDDFNHEFNIFGRRLFLVISRIVFSLFNLLLNLFGNSVLTCSIQ